MDIEAIRKAAREGIEITKPKRAVKDAVCCVCFGPVYASRSVVFCRRSQSLQADCTATPLETLIPCSGSGSVAKPIEPLAFVQCDRCKGEGVTFKSVDLAPRQCRDCSGSGLVCPSKPKPIRKVVCGMCNGEAHVLCDVTRRSMECPKCSGSGLVFAD